MPEHNESSTGDASVIAPVPWPKKSRAGHRIRMERLFEEAANIISMPVNTDRLDTLSGLIKSLRDKLDVIKRLDAQILEDIADEDYEKEFLEQDEATTAYGIRLEKIERFFVRQETQVSLPVLSSSASAVPEQKTVHTRSVNLPKLPLPRFSGDLLQWKTFHDTFDSAVHQDPSISNVQKFQYLRGQLDSEASRVIEGLALTNDNYEKAMGLLQERYGQSHKLVSSYMKALWEIPMPKDTTASLRMFYDTLESYIRGLESLDKTQDSYGDLLVPVIMDRLPGRVRTLITRDHGDKAWLLQDLRAAILREIQAAEAGTATSQYMSNTAEEYSPTAAFLVKGKKVIPKSQRQFTSTIKCVFCKGQHKATECSIVPEPAKRLDIAKRERLCFNCLGSHRVMSCNSTNRCRKCNRKHHTALCDPTRASGQRNPNTDNNIAPEQTATTVHNNLAMGEQLPQTGPVVLKTARTTAISGSKRVNVNVLLDEGSQRSFITSNCVDLLQLTAENTETVKLANFGAKTDAVRAMETTTVSLKTVTGHQIPLKVLIVPNISTPIRNQMSSSVLNLPHLKDLNIAQCMDSESIEIDILVGADYYWSIVEDDIRRGPGPTAVATKFGYLLSGPIRCENPDVRPSAAVLHVMADSTADERIMSQYWDLETIGIKDQSSDISSTDQSAYEQYKETHIKRLENGRYEAGFPWSEDHPPLPTNYTTASARTRSMVRRLEPNTRKVYNQIIDDQVNRGFISKIPDADRDRGHYLPHHAVKKDSATTPIRIVYDCSCKRSDHPSLNECLDAGPPLLNDLCAILLRFRVNAVGLASDIEKAFLQIQLAEQDRDFTKFLWISDPDDPESRFDTYHFNVVLFGAVCSPFILNSVVKTHFEENHSKTASDMQQNIYVDNILSGTDSSESAVNYYMESNHMMQSCGFHLRSWSSNDKALMDIVTNDGKAEQKSEVNALGMRWMTDSDKITYSRKRVPDDYPVTKREIVRLSSSLFDPLGYLSPCHISAKSLIQELWAQQLGWDDPIPDALKVKWHAIAAEPHSAQEMTIDRQFIKGLKNGDECELHVFTDGSPQAYGTAIYISCNGETSLVMAKTRVKPLKAITIPRMELMGAVIGKRLANFVINALQNELRITRTIMWIDSQIVIHWIKGNKKLPTFVQNRVKEIREFDCEVKYCPTKDNPADLLTRGITASALEKSDLWWKGPSWLSDGDWPICDLFDSQVLLAQDKNNENEPAVPAQVHLVKQGQETGISKVMDIGRYSSLDKLLRITALVLRFVDILKGEITSGQKCHLSVQELTRAETVWITAAQTETISREIAGIKSHNSVKASLVTQLRLFLDSDGVVRLGGRLHNAPVSKDTKFPVFLPKNHMFTTLVIQNAHGKVLHSGMPTTVTYIRQRFWIPRIREIVKSVIRKCVTCLKITGKPYRSPISPPLQSFRVTEAPPFTVTGIDFAGPLYVISSNTNAEDKVYLCLFTCAVTRAIHLEIVCDLTAGTFLNAFRRFCARRSIPSRIISDNAMTFLSAADEIGKITRSQTVQNHMISCRVEWKFIPKRAPWFGGFWERLVGLTKTVIKKVLGRARVTLDELTTVTTEVESVLNDRPLTYVGEDEPLTPSHLLHGRILNTMPHETLDIDEIMDPNFTLTRQRTMEKRAKYLAKIHQDFWQRWSSEYLPALRERHSATGKTDNVIKVGDVVIVHSDDKRRMHWNMAIVQELNLGKDGLARSATIKTKQGLTTRPITKLYPLEISCDSVPELSVKHRDRPRDKLVNDKSTASCPSRSRPATRQAAVKARDQVKAWTDILLRD